MGQPVLGHLARIRQRDERHPVTAVDLTQQRPERAEASRLARRQRRCPGDFGAEQVGLQFQGLAFPVVESVFAQLAGRLMLALEGFEEVPRHLDVAS